MTSLDWKAPDYTPIFAKRLERLKRIRSERGLLPYLKRYYGDHPADFINDWGVTVDPRNVERKLPAVMPFILFPRQREWIEWVIDHWLRGEPGLTEKSRDMGISWLAVSLAATLCIFNEGFQAGFGSRKEEYVDKSDSPKSLFWKARQFVQNLPREFRAGFTTSHLRLSFSDTQSHMTGEAGDNIGRGDRQSIYFVDESAHLERPQLIEQSLSATTNCRIDISSANGMANPFAQKRHGGKIDVFTFHWRDDPRKDEEWYQVQNDELDPVTVAQEIDINYSASVEGVLIPSAWVQAAIDAHLKLGIKPTGGRRGALDVADEGKDLNAFAVAHGILIEHAEEWSGKGDDIFGTVQRAFMLADDWELDGFRYDADGLGAGVRGDARVINVGRSRQLTVQPFRGSGAVIDPTREDVKGRTNEDFFMNLKAQSWWSLRKRFQTTFRAVTAPSVETAQNYDPTEIISISSAIPCLTKLCGELSQPTYAINTIGKIVVNKAPEGTRSPNLADSVMILFGRGERPPMVISEAALQEV